MLVATDWGFLYLFKCWGKILEECSLGFLQPMLNWGIMDRCLRRIFLMMLFEIFDLFGAIKFVNAVLYILPSLCLSTYCFSLAAPQPTEAVWGENWSGTDGAHWWASSHCEILHMGVGHRKWVSRTTRESIRRVFACAGQTGVPCVPQAKNLIEFDFYCFPSTHWLFLPKSWLKKET